MSSLLNMPFKKTKEEQKNVQQNLLQKNIKRVPEFFDKEETKKPEQNHFNKKPGKKTSNLGSLNPQSNKKKKPFENGSEKNRQLAANQHATDTYTNQIDNQSENQNKLEIQPSEKFNEKQREEAEKELFKLFYKNVKKQKPKNGDNQPKKNNKNGSEKSPIREDEDTIDIRYDEEEAMNQFATGKVPVLKIEEKAGKEKDRRK